MPVSDFVLYRNYELENDAVECNFCGLPSSIVAITESWGGDGVFICLECAKEIATKLDEIKSQSNNGGK